MDLGNSGEALVFACHYRKVLRKNCVLNAPMQRVYGLGEWHRLLR
jgi:hypothetical protein